HPRSADSDDRRRDGRRYVADGPGHRRGRRSGRATRSRGHRRTNRGHIRHATHSAGGIRDRRRQNGSAHFLRPTRSRERAFCFRAIDCREATSMKRISLWSNALDNPTPPGFAGGEGRVRRDSKVPNTLTPTLSPEAGEKEKIGRLACAMSAMLLPLLLIA